MAQARSSIGTGASLAARFGMLSAASAVMLKKILLALGLAKAPAPIRTYFAVSSFVGAVPALAYVAWKNRDRIKQLIQRATPVKHRLAATSTPATTTA